VGIGNDHVVNWNWIRSAGPKRTTADWRIQEIPHARSEVKGFASMLPVIGALVFIAAFALTILNQARGGGWALAGLILCSVDCGGTRENGEKAGLLCPLGALTAS
jgi:hypothetical protein